MEGESTVIEENKVVEEDLRNKTIILTNPTIEQDEKYSEMFRKGEIGGLITKFDHELEVDERGFSGLVEIRDTNNNNI